LVGASSKVYNETVTVTTVFYAGDLDSSYVLPPSLSTSSISFGETLDDFGNVNETTTWESSYTEEYVL
jgi:hypothetical protein